MVAVAAAVPSQPELVEQELKGLIEQKQILAKHVADYLALQSAQPDTATTQSPSSTRTVNASPVSPSSSSIAPSSIDPVFLLTHQQSLLDASILALNQTLSSFFLLRDVYLAAAYAERRVRAQLVLDQALQHTRKRGLEAMNDAVLSVLASALGAERVALYLVGKTHLFGLEPSDPSKLDEYRHRRFPRDAFLAGWSCSHAAPVLLSSNASSHPLFDSVPDALMNTRTHTLMCAPVVDEHEGVLAVIQVVNKVVVRSPPPPPLPQITIAGLSHLSSATTTPTSTTCTQSRRATSHHEQLQQTRQQQQQQLNSHPNHQSGPVPLARMFSTPVSSRTNPPPTNTDPSHLTKPFPLNLPSPTSHTQPKGFQFTLPNGMDEAMSSSQFSPTHLSRTASQTGPQTSSAESMTPSSSNHPTATSSPSVPLHRATSTASTVALESPDDSRSLSSPSPTLNEDACFTLEDLDLLVQLSHSLVTPLKRFLPEIVLDGFAVGGHFTDPQSNEQLIGTLGSFGVPTQIGGSGGGSGGIAHITPTPQRKRTSDSATFGSYGAQTMFGVTPDVSPRRPATGSNGGEESGISHTIFQSSIPSVIHAHPHTDSLPVSVPSRPGAAHSNVPPINRDVSPPPIPTASLPTMSRLPGTLTVATTPVSGRSSFIAHPGSYDASGADAVRSLVHSYAVAETNLLTARGSARGSARSRTLSFQWPSTGVGVSGPNGSGVGVGVGVSGGGNGGGIPRPTSVTPPVISPTHGLPFAQTIPPHPVQRVFSIEDLHSLQFNVFDYSEAELLRFTVGIFRSMGLIDEFKISLPTLQRFLLGVKADYHPNPFHNFIHVGNKIRAGRCFLIMLSHSFS